MKLNIICCLLAALVSVGCRRKTPPADPGTPAATSQPAGSPAPAAPKGEFTPAPAVPADSPAAKAHSEMDQKLASGNVQLQLQVLDELLQAWVMSQNSIPKDLQALVGAKMLTKVPTPPSGKRFAVDQKTGRVVLLNQ